MCGQSASDVPATRQVLPRDVVPKHYNLTLYPNPNPPFKFFGTVDIDVEICKPVDKIHLHALKVTIDSASFVPEGASEAVASTNIEYATLFPETASIAFSSNLSAGKGVLKLAFTAEHSDDMCGFYRSKTKLPTGEEYYTLVTQFEPTDARRCIPCWDEPSVKATWGCELVLPVQLGTSVALSNTSVASDSKSARPTEGPVAEYWAKYEADAKAADATFTATEVRRIKFDATPRMSSYLLAFVVGEFDHVERECTPVAAGEKARPCLVRIYTPVGKSARGTFALDVATRTLEYFASYFDVGFPLPKMDMVAIADFAAGAMENWGLVTYRETALLCDEATSGVSDLQAVAYVVAHELAHQWFGNLVTMRWWDELWLNEGYATYVGTQAAAHLFPEWDMWTAFVTNYCARALGLDAKASTHPVQVEVSSSAEVNEIFDAISYCKGASLIRFMVSHIGEDAFQKGIRTYLKAFAYSNASTGDLWTHMATAAGSDVAAVMDPWVRAPGFPVVTAKAVDGGVEVTQKRFFEGGEDSAPAGEKAAAWPVQLVCRSGDEKIPTALPADLAAKTVIRAGGSGADAPAVIVNAGANGFFRSVYDSALTSRIATAIRAGEKGGFTATERLSLIGDAWATAKAGYSSTVDALVLTREYAAETDQNVWSEVVANVGGFRRLVDAAGSADAAAGVRRYVQELVRGAAEKVGLVRAEKEAATTTQLRVTLVSALIAAGCKKTIDALLAKAEEDPNALDADLRGLAYVTKARYGTAEDRLAFRAKMLAADEADEKRRLLSAAATPPSSTIASDEEITAFVHEVLDWAIRRDGDVKPQDAFSVPGTAASGSNASQVAVWTWLKANWDRVLSLYESGNFLLGSIIARGLGSVSDAATADDIAAFFAARPVPSAARAVEQTLEGARARISWWARDGAAVEDFLKKIQ